jgi:DNA-binding response OmpR family regulator
VGDNKSVVVEDDADYREMIMVFLLRSGYEAQTLDSVFSGLKKVPRLSDFAALACSAQWTTLPRTILH